LVVNLNQTESVTPESLPHIASIKSAVETAWHEAGHALVNEHLGRPSGPLQYLTIEGQSKWAGYAHYNVDEFDGPVTFDILIRRLAKALAGGVTEGLQGIPRNGGWGDDLRQVRQTTMYLIAQAALIPGFEFIPVGSDGVPDLTKLSADRLEKLNAKGQWVVSEALGLATRIMSDPKVKAQAEKIVETLVTKGSISGKNFEEVIGEYRYSESQTKEFIKSCQEALEN
jgi:ATP-dependent Zn protease